MKNNNMVPALIEFAGFYGSGKSAISESLSKKIHLANKSVIIIDNTYLTKNKLGKILYYFPYILIFCPKLLSLFISIKFSSSVGLKQTFWFVKYYLLMCIFYKKMARIKCDVVILTEGFSCMDYFLSKYKYQKHSFLFNEKCFTKIKNQLYLFCIKRDIKGNYIALAKRSNFNLKYDSDFVSDYNNFYMHLKKQSNNNYLSFYEVNNMSINVAAEEIFRILNL